MALNVKESGLSVSEVVSTINVPDAPKLNGGNVFGHSRERGERYNPAVIEHRNSQAATAVYVDTENTYVPREDLQETVVFEFQLPTFEQVEEEARLFAQQNPATVKSYRMQWQQMTGRK